MKSFNKILWGLVFIIIGLILGSNSLGFTSIDIFFDGWWTLFLIIPGFIGLITDKDKTGNLICLLIGIFLLLASRGLLDFELVFKLMVPIILVIIGLSMIFKDAIGNQVSKKIKEMNNSTINKKEYCATFSGQQVDFTNEVINGVELSAVFGSIGSDFRKAKLKDEQVINVSSIFGGVELLMPEDVNIKINSNSIFGGVSEKRKNNLNEHTKTVYVNASCIFGGVEIK